MKLNNEYLSEINQELFPTGVVKKIFKEELDWYEIYYDIEYTVLDHYYFTTSQWFQSFFQTNFQLRQEAKKNPDKDKAAADDMLAKLNLNSTVGMLGKNPYKQKVIYLQNIELQRGQKYLANLSDEQYEFVITTVKNKVGNLNVYQGYFTDINGKRDLPKTCYNFYVNAQITMRTRCMLYEAIYKLKDNFIYCDTDSIYCKIDLEGKDIINIDNTKLGAWKAEKRYKYAKFMKSKCYILSNKLIVDYDTILNKDCKITVAGFSITPNFNHIDLNTWGWDFQYQSKAVNKTQTDIQFTSITKTIKSPKKYYN